MTVRTTHLRRSLAALVLPLALVVAPTAVAAGAGSSPGSTGSTGSVALGLPGATADRACDRTTDPDRWSALLHAALDLATALDPAASHAERWTVLDVTEVDDPGAPGNFDAYGRADLASHRATLSPLVPCWALTSVVLHEAAHLGQAAAGLTQAAYAADPARWELAADRAAYRALPARLPADGGRRATPYAPYLAAHLRLHPGARLVP